MSEGTRYLLWLAGVAMLALVLLVAASFVAFVEQLDVSEPEDPPKAQGIVVLTGGADRLADGLRLLDAGLGQRLLVSGVNRGTSLGELKRLLPMHAPALTCCTDLGYEAGNTRGNARETARWAARNRMKSLIVVTASYHLPRVRIEFATAMPGVNFSFYPVVPDSAGLQVWWREPALMRILALEYAKFRLAQVRIGLGLGARSAPADAAAP